MIQVRRSGAFARWRLMAVAMIVATASGAGVASGSPLAARAGAGYHYAVPVQQGSPWPTMRRDLRNTAFSPIVGVYRTGEKPWGFRTGKGVFSTPIVGGNGTVYVGSADTWFYAISPKGKLEWKFKTGNLIDSAGFIGAWSPRYQTYPVAVPSGDTHLYLIRSNDKPMSRAKRIIWKFTPPPHSGVPGQVPPVNWWEGNAEPGPDGTIYAGNTGDAAYALHPNGTLKWVYRSFGPFWTDPAIGPNGNTYWGSLDLQVHAISSSGQSVWRLPTLGFVTSSPALSRNGTLYIGSFDSDLYAIDAATGLPEWKFQTGGDIYASPALDENANGTVRAIYIASTGGEIYALSPSGSLLWSYDTGDVIRSSPVIGLGPNGVDRIVYVGAGNGTLYAINAANGTRRWSFNTTLTRNPVLRDRNDLNGSPALTKTGIVIGGEDGYVSYVPYDYCLHVRDRRCDTKPGQTFAPNMKRLYAVTAGGNTQLRDGVQNVGSSAVMPIRLVVTHDGQTLDGAMQPRPDAHALIKVAPAFPFHAETSGDGHYIFVVPDGFLRPGRTYSIRIHGRYEANGAGLGDIRLGGSSAGTFNQTIPYRIAPAAGRVPFHTSASKVSAMSMTRLAFPLPAFLTSVDQIGFDAYDLIVGVLSMTRPNASGGGSVLLWAIGAHPGPGGVEEADPHTQLGFALAGRYQGNSINVSASNATLTFSFGSVPVQTLDLRAQLSRNLTAMPGADIYGEVICAKVPTYGPLLPTQRLCNNEGKLVANGTYLTGPYSSKGPANRRPRGLRLRTLTYSPPSPATNGSVVAELNLARGATYPARSHVVSIVLTDAATGAPVGLDYRADTATGVDAHGNIRQVKLTLPAGTSMPSSVRAYVVSDVFPLASRILH